MPIPDQRDPALTRKVLTEWLGEKLPDARDLTIGELTSPGFTGFSNETLLFDATWTEGGEPRREGLVVRVAPTSYRVFMEADFENQYRLLSVLDRDTDVPVPSMRWYEGDEGVLGAPFFVMGKVDGRVPADSPPYNTEGWVAEATTEQRERLWINAMDAFARVHRVPLDKVEFLAKPGRGATGLDQQVCYWEESLEWAARGKPQPTAEAAWEWLSANVPSERPTGLSWGDCRIGNIIFDDAFDAAAVVDWEMVSLGGPLMDLGWWLFLDSYHTTGVGATRLPGLGDRAGTVSRWEELTGMTARDLDWYEAFAGLRFAVVMMRLAQTFESYGILTPEMADMETNNAITHLLARMLELPPPGPIPAGM